MKKKILILLALWGLPCALSFSQPNSFLPDGPSIHGAARSGDVKSIEALIKNGIDPNVRNQLGYSPLHIAIFYNQLEAIQALLRLGADSNIKTNLKNTPLSQAFDQQNLEAMKLLLEAGADPNAKTNFGNTPLPQAIDKKNLEAIKLLLEAGADPNAKTNFGNTLLHQVIKQNNLEAIKILTKAGASLDVQDTRGQTALELARLTNNQDIIDFFEAYISERRTQSNSASCSIIPLNNNNNNNAHHRSNESDEDTDISPRTSGPTIIHSSSITHSEEPSLHELVQRSNLSSTETSIEEEADPNIQNNFDQPAQDLPICSNSREMASFLKRILSEREAKMNPTSNSGIIPHFNNNNNTGHTAKDLIIAAERGDITAIESLVRAGIDPNLGNSSAWSPLYRAILKNQLEAAKALLRLGAIVNSNEELMAGWTPLHLAVNQNNLEAVKLLTEAGADWSLKNNDGETPLDFARLFNDLAIINFLQPIIVTEEETAPSPSSVILLQANNNNNDSSDIVTNDDELGNSKSDHLLSKTIASRHPHSRPRFYNSKSIFLINFLALLLFIHPLLSNT